MKTICVNIPSNNTVVYALVDDENFTELSQYQWHLNKDGYAERSTKARKRLMHRVVLKLTDRKTQGDHVDLDKLNNQKNNLRTCSHQQNMCNRTKKKNNTTGFKGVEFDKKRLQFRARIRSGKVKYCSKYFDTAVDAASAYNELAIKHHGTFARLNVIA
jgi:hypothetical protein